MACILPHRNLKLAFSVWRIRVLTLRKPWKSCVTPLADPQSLHSAAPRDRRPPDQDQSIYGRHGHGGLRSLAAAGTRTALRKKGSPSENIQLETRRLATNMLVLIVRWSHGCVRSL